MTRCRFALYDPAQRTPGRGYWAWLAEGLDPARLDRLYYEAAVRNRPPDPNRLLPEEIWGGIADMGDDQVGLYRFFNGGRDDRGRPGRFVLLVTLLTRDEVLGRDLSPIFLCETARQVALRAPGECPLAIPASLEEEVELPDAMSHGTAMTLPGDPCWHRQIRPAADPEDRPVIHDEERVAPREVTVGGAGIESEERVAPRRSESDQANPSPPFCVSLDELRDTLRGFATSAIGRRIVGAMMILLLFDIWYLFPSSPIVQVPEQPSVTTNIPVATPTTPRSLNLAVKSERRRRWLQRAPTRSLPPTENRNTGTDEDVHDEANSSSARLGETTGQVVSNTPVESENRGFWWTMIPVMFKVSVAVVFMIIAALVTFLLIQPRRERG